VIFQLVELTLNNEVSLLVSWFAVDWSGGQLTPAGKATARSGNIQALHESLIDFMSNKW